MSGAKVRQKKRGLGADDDTTKIRRMGGYICTQTAAIALHKGVINAVSRRSTGTGDTLAR
jgi:hypothetical protein